MRLSQFPHRNATHKTLLVSGLALFVAAFPACDSKSGSNAQATATTVEQSTATSSATPSRTLDWKLSRPTNHTFQMVKSSSHATLAGTDSQNLRAAFIKTVQAGASSEYAAKAMVVAGSQAFHFDNRGHQIAADLTQDGVSVNVNNAAVNGSATFQLTGIGCSNNSATVAAARPVSSDGRVSFTRPEVVEWYKNGPLGLEQGFDIAAAPACRATSHDSAIELKVQVGHRLHPTLMHGKDGATWLELRDDKNQVVLHYSDLYAEDADGKVLPTTLAFSSDVLTLHISDGGARYPLRIDPLIWSQINNRYKAADADANDQFGFSIAISGDHAIVGAPFDDENCGSSGDCNSGAAYIFTLNSQGSWSQQMKFLGLPPAVSDDPGGNFGHAVAITDLGGGDKRVAIGAPLDPGDTSGLFGTGGYLAEGLVAWFRGRADTWSIEGQFNGDAADQLGYSVGVSGDHIIVGEPVHNTNDGGVIIYEPDVLLSPPWGEAARILDSGNAGSLGTSVAIDGNVAVMGSWVCCSTGTPGPANQGAAFVWERETTGPMAGSWFKTADLLASDAAAGDKFGTSVAVQGLTAIIGAIGKNSNAGAAYIFTDIIGTWGEQADLHTISNPAPGANFGYSVSVIGKLAAVGAFGTTVDGNPNAGTVYLYGRSGDTWSALPAVSGLNQLYAQDPAPPHNRLTAGNEDFGASVSIDPGLGHILVGSNGEDTKATNSGAFWDFILRKDIGDPCAANAECATDFCIDGVCCNSACGGGNPNDCLSCVNTVGGMASIAKGPAGICGTANTTEVCHTQSDLCDVTLNCDGSATTCGNFAAAAMTPCRPAVGGCDITEVCDGTSPSCPADMVRPVQFVCRTAAGICDVPEQCNGQDKSCPADLVKPSFTICRLPSGGECDQFEVCDGSSIDCPADAKSADNTPCSAGSCQAGICRAEANLGVALSGPPTVTPNQDLDYTVAVTNYGRSTATNVSVIVALSDGATLTSSSGNATCQSVATGVQCTIASLGASQTDNISLQIHPPAQPAMTLTATVSSDLPDPDMTNNTATLQQNLLSPRISGGGAGCSAVPGGVSGFGNGAALLGLLALITRRRRRSS